MVKESESTLFSIVTSYAARGWSVLPIWGVSSTGTCRCLGSCTSPGKHPMTKTGYKEASREIAKLAEWFGRDDSNVGIRTGIDSGLVVLDIDDRHDGEVGLGTLDVIPGHVVDQDGHRWSPVQ